MRRLTATFSSMHCYSRVGRPGALRRKRQQNRFFCYFGGLISLFRVPKG
jgi:hypothetical protein